MFLHTNPSHAQGADILRFWVGDCNLVYKFLINVATLSDLNGNLCLNLTLLGRKETDKKETTRLNMMSVRGGIALPTSNNFNEWLSLDLPDRRSENHVKL